MTIRYPRGLGGITMRGPGSDIRHIADSITMLSVLKSLIIHKSISYGPV